MGYVCGKDGAEMEEVYDIEIQYNDMELPEAEGIRCPECGMEFLLEDLVTGELNEAELMLESK
jgi:YgiT-type zinc finger domain-containing protein